MSRLRVTKHQSNIKRAFFQCVNVNLLHECSFDWLGVIFCYTHIVSKFLAISTRTKYYEPVTLAA